MPVPALLNLLDLRLNLVRFLPVADGLVKRDDVVLDVPCLVPSPNLEEGRVLAGSAVWAAVVVVVVVVTITVVVAVPVSSVSISVSRARTRGRRKRRHGKVLEMLAVGDDDVQPPARGHVDVFAVTLEVEVVAPQGAEDGFALERGQTLAAEADGARGVGVRVDGR